MNPFLRLIALLMALLVLAGCGRGRSAAPPGKPYAVTFAAGVWVSASATPACSTTASSQGTTSRGGSGGGFSCSGNFLGGGSGKDALLGLAAVIAVVLVVATVVCVVDSVSGATEPSALDDRYHLTLSGPDVPTAVVVITASNHVYLEHQQHDALMRGAYVRAVLRPAVWEGTRGAPTQPVKVSLVRGQAHIEPLEPATVP